MPENPDDYIDGEEYEEDYESDSEEEEDEVDEKRRRLLCAIGALTISLPFLGLGALKSCIEMVAENPANIYLGKWSGVLAHDQFKISRSTGNPDDMAHEEVVVPNAGTAKLILPIDIPKLSYARRGGVYQLNDHHTLILYCLTCCNDIVLGLKKEEEQMKIGVHDYHVRSLNDQMTMGHTARHLKYNPKKWITYNPIK